MKHFSWIICSSAAILLTGCGTSSPQPSAAAEPPAETAAATAAADDVFLPDITFSEISGDWACKEGSCRLEIFDDGEYQFMHDSMGGIGTLERKEENGETRYAFKPDQEDSLAKGAYLIQDPQYPGSLTLIHGSGAVLLYPYRQLANPFIANWYDDVKDSLADPEEVNLSASQGAQKFVIYPEWDVKNFAVVSLSDMNMKENGEIEFRTEELYHKDLFEGRTNLLITAEIPETIPNLGIRFERDDADHTISCYSISVSGKDGTLVLTPFTQKN